MATNTKMSTKIFCDACGELIPDTARRAEMAVSWSVPVNIQNREYKYEVCLLCARKLRRMLEGKSEARIYRNSKRKDVHV